MRATQIVVAVIVACTAINVVVLWRAVRCAQRVQRFWDTTADPESGALWRELDREEAA